MVGLQAAQGGFALLDHVPAVVAGGVGILVIDDLGEASELVEYLVGAR